MMAIISAKERSLKNNSLSILDIILRSSYNIILTLRPRQWTKNLLLLAALIFSSNLNNLSLVFKTLEGFLIFCLISGCIYIFNDIIDIKSRSYSKSRLEFSL